MSIDRDVLYPPICFDRNGRLITEAVARELALDEDYALVAREEVGDLVVDTRWRGHYVSHFSPRGEDGRPLLFETLAFGDGFAAGTERRYATRVEAAAGHPEVVAEVRARQTWFAAWCSRSDVVAAAAALTDAHAAWAALLTQAGQYAEEWIPDSFTSLTLEAVAANARAGESS